MSDGERSPKRQRTEGSYSPASPPIATDTKPGQRPFTPPPSVRMSPSWQTQSQTTTQQPTSGSFPSPPSTAGFQSQMAGRGAGSDGGGGSGRHTPSSEALGDAPRDLDGDAHMADPQGSEEEDVPMADAEHRRTDHERQGSTKDVAGLSSNDVLPLYKLHTTPVTRSRPHPSQDFIQMYGLQRIQRSVARRDLVTGEKINKLRKSYENKVKNLGFAGRNKAQSNQGELQGLLDPLWDEAVESGESMWDAKTRDSGKHVDNPNSHQELESKLSAAFGLLPGRLAPKEHKEWHSMLGLDDLPNAAAIKAAPANSARPTVASATAKTAPASAARASAPSSPRSMLHRPERSGKKRSYQDSSFEGYSEGYEDDGYSTGGLDDTGRRRDSAKRQKRKDYPPSQQNSPSFTHSPANAVRSS